MKMLNKEQFFSEAGMPLTHKRDFSLYDGAPYECACGSTHRFHQHSNNQPYGSTGASAKFVIACPQHSNCFTLIKTKNKFVILFDRFLSLAGYHQDDNP